MTYEKPRVRKGMVCWFCQWWPDGRVRRAYYRRMGREDRTPAPPRETSPMIAPPMRRSALAAERRAAQATLDL